MRPLRTRHFRAIWLLIGLGLVIASCQGADTPSPLLVTGRVTAGPTCPAMTASPDPDCADRPVPRALLIVRDASGAEVARTRSGPDGRFEISLPPGTYRLIPQAVDGLLGTAPERALLLGSGATPEVLAIGYDTGIR